MCVEIRLPNPHWMTLHEGEQTYDEYAPVDENGTVWGPRTLQQAKDAMLAWPKGGSYGTFECTCAEKRRTLSLPSHGDECRLSTPYAGVTHIVKRTVTVKYGDWVEIDSAQRASR